jgi:Carboxypeptidase regulatory-like domain
MRSVRIAALALLLAHSALNGQQPSPASIQGNLVHAGTGEPLAKVTVELRGQQGATLASTRTEADGKFYLSAPPGRYRLVATRSAFVKSEYGQRSVNGAGQELTLAPGQRMNDVRLKMTPGASIAGLITEKGQPVGIADVVVLKPVYVEGQLALDPLLADRTDDKGEYHLFWLPPGRYYLVAVAWDTADGTGQFNNPDTTDNTSSLYAQRFIGRSVLMRAIGAGANPNEAHVPIYFPGTPDPLKATPIEVRAGADMHGVNIDIYTLPTRRVQGQVTGNTAVNPNGQPIRANVALRPMTAAGNATTNIAQSPNGQADPQGNFDFPNVIPGRYLLTATAGNLSGRANVEVREGNTAGLLVSMGTGFSITGRVTVERPAPISPDPVLAGLRVNLRTDPPIPGTPAYGAAVAANGTFTIPQLPPNPNAQRPAGPPAGEYRVLVNPILTPPNPQGLVSVITPALPPALQNAYVKSIRMGDMDLLNGRLQLQSSPQDPIEIVIGINPGATEGRVLDERQQPVPSATVVLIPDNGLKYRISHRVAISDAAGGFQFKNVPPGDYNIYAWEEIDASGWQDPGYMQSYEPLGKRINISEGKTISLDVSLIPAGR